MKKEENFIVFKDVTKSYNVGEKTFNALNKINFSNIWNI